MKEKRCNQISSGIRDAKSPSPSHSIPNVGNNTTIQNVRRMKREIEKQKREREREKDREREREKERKRERERERERERSKRKCVQSLSSS